MLGNIPVLRWLQCPNEAVNSPCIHSIDDTVTYKNQMALDEDQLKELKKCFVLRFPVFSDRILAAQAVFITNADWRRQALNLMSEAIPEEHPTGCLFPVISGHRMAISKSTMDPL